MKTRFGYGLLAASVGVLALTATSLFANAPANQPGSTARAAISNEGAGGGDYAVVYEGADQAVVKVPFMFAAGGAVLPSGTYRVAPESDNPDLLQIRSDDGRRQAIVETLLEGATNNTQHARFLFKDYQGSAVLSAVALPGARMRSIPISSKTLEKDLQAMARIRFRTESTR